MTKGVKVYDLEERNAKFGKSIIEVLKSIKKNNINLLIINQLIKSGTSVGTNYCKADCAEFRKDFEHNKHWLRVIAKANSEIKDKA